MQKTFESVVVPTLGGGAKRRIWLAMATVFTLALVVSLAWGIYGIATP
jgi:hypothetical protein